MTKHSQNISASIMALVLSYLNSDECLEMSFSKYSKKFFDCHYNHMQRRFKKDVGVNIAVFLIAEKVKMAKNLIKEHPYLSFTEVSIKCRYKYLSHMTNHFKKMIRMTPMDYRKQLIDNKLKENTYNDATIKKDI